MTTLESIIYFGNRSYTIATLLNNMKDAFSKDEAMRWGFCIKTAFIEFGHNPEIDKAMKNILDSLGIPPIVARNEESKDGDLNMPPLLINYIFKNEFNQEQLKKLWCWIKEYSIDEISYPYHYLSLLLFLENHHSKFLQKPCLLNTEMKTQMEAWFPKVKTKCSADAIGTYHNGYFNGVTFKYASWLNSTGEPPLGYVYKKDQTLAGFIALNKLCNTLELNLSELKI